MREIKFRAWDEDNKGWWPHIEIYSDGSYLVGQVEDSYSGLVLSAKKPIIQQFTGLRDKNGQEIFEGDLVHEYNWCDNSYSGVREVHFHDGGFFACSLHENGSCSARYSFCEAFDVNGYEVIGNIHENPELVK